MTGGLKTDISPLGTAKIGGAKWFFTLRDVKGKFKLSLKKADILDLVTLDSTVSETMKFCQYQ